MKRIGTTILLAILMLTCLSACSISSKPSNGTYKSDEGLLSQTWTFSGSNDVVISMGSGLVRTSGTYTIDGNTLSVSATLLDVPYTTSYTITEVTSNSFFIDGTKFIKQ